MIRVILGIIASLFLFSVVRTIMAAMKKEFQEQNRAASSPGHPAPQRKMGGELRKCPSCGTYHAVPNIGGKTREGELVHFCSAGCRDKFAA
jgi:hypothetical protein